MWTIYFYPQMTPDLALHAGLCVLLACPCHWRDQPFLSGARISRIIYGFLAQLWNQPFFQEALIPFSKEWYSSQVPVAHTCNPSYSRGWDQEDLFEASLGADNLQDSISKYPMQERASGVEWLKWQSICLASVRPCAATHKKTENQKPKTTKSGIQPGCWWLLPAVLTTWENWDREDCNSRPAQTNSSGDPISKK
jgi:hypothetical protein